MKLLNHTYQTIADLPNMLSRMKPRYILRGFLRCLLLAVIYWITVDGSPALLGFHPLVVAWCVVALAMIPFSYRSNVSQFASLRNGWICVSAIVSLLSIIILFLNEPLWLKRITSVFALFQICYCLFAPTLIRENSVKRKNWNVTLFRKSRMFQIPAATLTLALNEIAIWTNNDWLWIASQTTCVALLPLVYVLVAHMKFNGLRNSS